MNSNPTQCKAILAHLQQAPITPLDALNLYGCFRLASRISELKKDQHPIDKRMIELESGKKVAQYFLLKTA